MKNPVTILTFREMHEELNKYVQKCDIDACDVLCIDFDADVIIPVTESNMSIYELNEAWKNGDIIFVRREV